MAKYAIYEGNMERLTKKMIRIQNKCRKYGCDFRFEEVGEEFRTFKDEDGIEYTMRYVLVDAEGKASISGWEFIATLDCTDNGNIINKAVDDVEVPERYYKNAPVCEHCGNQNVLNTFIIRNIKTGEFKQVGKSCLNDYLYGLDADVMASYMSMFNELVKGEAPYRGSNIVPYYKPEELLRYIAEVINHWGYVKSDGFIRSTLDRAFAYYKVNNGGIHHRKSLETYINEMESVGFDSNSEKAVSDTASALAWIKEQPEKSNYIHNLKVVCEAEYISTGFGILASLFPAWNRDLEYKARAAREAKVAAESKHIGNIGDRVNVDIAECRCVTGWETEWGYCYIYRFVDKDGNVFTWKTTKDIDCDSVKSLKGTVKAHTEFRGTNQTEMTRCKVA